MRNTLPKHATVAREIGSPVGKLVLLASRGGLAGVYFGHRAGNTGLPQDGEGGEFLDWAERELGEYFAGERREFEVVLNAVGTEFQRAVWGELSRIGYGETASYGEIAARIGNPGAVRAVGLANGANPISVIVPCHRVIGADGSLTGFGGGLEMKRRLLEMEKQGGERSTFNFQRSTFRDSHLTPEIRQLPTPGA